MLEGGLYSGRLIIVCSFCLKEDCSITGGFISAGAGGGGVHNRLLRYVSFLATVLTLVTDWVQALVQ